MKYLITVFIIIFLISCQKDDFNLNETIKKNELSGITLDTVFFGYKVDFNALQQSRANDFGKEYWKNTPLQSDLIVAKFQKPYGNKLSYGTFFYAVCNGDFNNDGYIDVFNGGSLFTGIQAKPSFLIWNVTNKKFEEQNLFKQNVEDLGNPSKVVAAYINNDDFVDLMIFSHTDEGLSIQKRYKITQLLSDGNGKYDIKELNTENPIMIHESGDLGDLNGDKIIDLVVNNGGLMSILWGIKSYPYFDESKPAYFCSMTYGTSNGFYYPYKNDNGFGESAPEIVDRHVWNSYIIDIDKDGWNDIILSSGEDTSSNSFNYNRIIINLGGGRFNKNSIVDLPLNSHLSNNVDYILDDLNQDGKNDIITSVNDETGNWYFLVYYQNENKRFILNKKTFIKSSNTTNYRDIKPKLIYCDINKDGKKDLSYVDGADNGQLKNKTTFIRQGDFFVEQNFFQYDGFLKNLYENN